MKAKLNITADGDYDFNLPRGANTISIDIGGTWDGATATFYKRDRENGILYNISQTLGGVAISTGSNITFTVDVGADGKYDDIRVNIAGGGGSMDLWLKINGGSIQ